MAILRADYRFQASNPTRKQAMPSPPTPSRFRAHFAPAVALASMALAGCSLASLAPPAATPRMFDLAPALSQSRPRAGADWQLVVNEPVTLRVLDGDRIAVRSEAAELSYFADAVWVDKLPRLLQARVIQAMQRSGRFRAVGNGRDKLEADLGLSLEVEAFEVEMVRGSARAMVALHAKLVDERRGEALASRRFSMETKAKHDDAGAGVAALNDAFGALLPQLVAWSAAVPFSRPQREVGPRAQPSPSPDTSNSAPADKAPSSAPIDGVISQSGHFTPASGRN